MQLSSVDNIHVHVINYTIKKHLVIVYIFFKQFFLLFQEEGDNEYESEDSESDFTDSDISIDENDEVKSDAEDGEDGKRKKRGVNTKAYKVFTAI